jgi:signal transduction histidine kinase
LFEPFVTAGKQDGLGLGLALSRQTVLNHGGDIWTEPAAGARFVIRLPLNLSPGVSFPRKVDIANYAIISPRTIREDI